jgi:hypothetical protein
MINPGSCRTVDELVAAGTSDVRPLADTIADFGEESPSVRAALDFGVPFSSAAAISTTGLARVEDYRALVEATAGSAWMDNTTLLTAATLLSSDGPRAMTPLTVWDLVTFVRAVISYERIYHHEHPLVEDAAINDMLGADVVTSVPLPFETPSENSPLPADWVGPHRLMSEIWEQAYGWIVRLAEHAGTPTFDGVQLEAVRDAWRTALGDPELRVGELTDWKEAKLRWRSPSNELLERMADATDVRAGYISLDPAPEFREQARLKADAGIKPSGTRANLLTDLNLRAYVNQRVADFFALPYVTAAARVPFRRHLDHRAVAIHQRLVALDVIDNEYARVATDLDLQLPVFLALAIRDAGSPGDVWGATATLRDKAAAYRTVRLELDGALARRDAKEAARVAKALAASVDNVLQVAGSAMAAASVAAVEEIAKGDLTGVVAGVAAVQAAGQNLLKSSVAERLLWRWRRPHLLWMNNVIDESKSLVEALPDFSRIWKIPEPEQSTFAARFQNMRALQA